MAHLRVRVDRKTRKLILHNGAGEQIEVGERTWSPWLQVKFKFSFLQSVTGIVRFYCRQLDPWLEFYASPINFDPAAPVFPISSPSDYGKELAGQIGNFSSLGMAEDHGGLENGRLDEAAYHDQCNLVLAEREAMTLFELDRFSGGLFFVVFDTPDRFQHMFWRFRDPEHPFFDATAAKDLADAVEQHYRRYDALLGRVMERVDEETLLIVLSDHGFHTFRRAVDINTWLLGNDLLKTRGDGEHAEVDWSRSFAYAIGLGGIYLNRKGRESQGIVDADGQAERVCEAISAGLSGLRDPLSGKVSINSVARSEQLYSGPYAAQAPDLLVNFAPGFRVSWESALGKMSGSVFQDNLRRWSGDHIMDPRCVPGILLLNKNAPIEDADIRDIAPTVLKYLDLRDEEHIEGKSLL